MKLRLSILLLAAALAAAPAAGQTIKSLGFNTTNGQVVYSGTNRLTFTNSLLVASQTGSVLSVGNTNVQIYRDLGSAALVFTANGNTNTFEFLPSGTLRLSGPLSFDATTNAIGYAATTRTNLGATTVGNSVFTATNAAAAATAIGLGTTNAVTFGAVEVGEGDALYLYGAGVESLGFGGGLNFEERRLSQDGSPIFDWGSGFTVTPAATFLTNVTVNGTLSVGSLTTTTPSTWALDATQTAADTNGILALPSNANVIRLTNNTAISGVSGGVLGAFYYLVNQTTNAVTISNVGGITVQGGTPLTLGAGQAATLVATGATNASVAARGDLNDVTLGGTLNKAPAQTANSADSLMTRDLTDTRMVDYIMHAPNRFRNLTYAMASHISGTGTAVHAGPITEGRINVRIVNGSTNSFASVKVNRQGPWNGTEGAFGIDWSRPMSLAVMGSKNQITNNVTRAFLVFGAGGGDNDLPTNGHWVALNWVNPTNAEVLVSKAGVVTTNATTITTSASPLGFGLWIEHKTNGTGDIYYAERNSATSAALQKPTNATVTYSNGPMVASTNQTSLTFGLVGLSTNTGASFEIVGLNNAVFFAP